jgi:hypothetical protein
MPRCHLVFLVVAVALLSSSAPAQNLGTPSMGWVTVTAPAQAYDSGFVDVGVYAYQVEYNYSPGDTAASVLAGLKAGFNSPSSPVTAAIAGNVLILTSKTTGSASNSSSLFAIYFGASFSATYAGMVGGRDGARNFRMMAYDGSTIDGDVNAAAYTFGFGGQQQTPAHSIIGVFAPQTDAFPGLHAWWDGGFATNWQNLITQNQFDMSRIDAVNVDEPYLQLFGYLGYPLTGDPCAPGDYRYPALSYAHDQLQAAAAAIKQSSPTTRFWVNFEANEVGWMQNGSCAFLDAPYIDVVSLDDYQVGSATADFLTVVKPYYDWFIAHPAYPGQQIALIPGTFVGRGTDPATQAKNVEEYFDYATSMNQSCTFPLGSGFVTGIYDGCPVWLVVGFVYNDTPDGYIGLSDPAAAAVQAAWGTELSNWRVDHGLPAIQILAVQHLLN